MKKYFPIILFILVFSGFLASQIGLDIINLSAGLTSEDRKAKAYYNHLYSQIEFRSTEGNPIELNSPIVILVFWASWCQPCLAELESLVELHQKFPTIQIIAINTDEEDQLRNIAKVQKLYQITFPVVADQDGEYLSQFFVSAIPFSIVYYQGEVRGIYKEAKDYAAGEVMEHFQNLLAK